ncbi:DUF6609 family protein [Brevibacillus choshinensis]|uniref:DUF6609 family protein n=1 Tax=Brevibacillus choshinensis TaxID=54911 RepID=UPI00399C749C
MVPGKIMLPLATLVSLNAFIGEMNPTIDFHVFAYVDVSLKISLVFYCYDQNQLRVN